MKAKWIIALVLAGLTRPALPGPTRLALPGPAFQAVGATPQTRRADLVRSASSTRAAVEFLASDRLEGRDTGSPGERLAGDYIAMQLARAGAKPLPGHRDMFMPFEFTAGTRDGGSNLTIHGAGGTSQAWSGAEQ